MKRLRKKQKYELIILAVIVLLVLAYRLFRPKRILEQFHPPREGEKFAVLQTNYGELRIRLFEKVAPMAVDNFVTRVRNGYYKDRIFFGPENKYLMVEDDNTGSRMNTVLRGNFKDEFHSEYCHFRGAVCVTKYSPAEGVSEWNSNVFYIVTKKDIDPEILEIMEDPDVDSGYSEAVISAYREHGGLYESDYRTTVFGQVYSGMEVLDKVDSLREAIRNEKSPPLTIQQIRVFVNTEGSN